MVLDVAGLVIGVVAIVMSIVAYGAAAYQNRLTASSVAADWLRDLRSWASEAIDVLAEESYTCRAGDPSPSEDETLCLLRCRHRLSALIDRGRLLLPNERADEYGGYKAGAYRGLRHPALDALVASDLVLEGTLPLHAFPDRKAALTGLRREFVSAIQAIIDPQSYNKSVAKLLRLASVARAKDPTRGGLLPDAKKVPTGEEGMMATASSVSSA